MIADLFAGAGGWDIATRHLGLPDPIGYELNADACNTRRAAGMPTIESDITEAELPGRLDGLIASPPCQSFSAAGKRAGLNDARGKLVWEPLRWIKACRPRWVALEQVPEVLPIWQAYKTHLTELGYSVWIGVLDAERYGVPQTRSRAILIAHRDRPVSPPTPTHQRYVFGVAQGDRHACGLDSLFGDPVEPWVSMADALGWGMTCMGRAAERWTHHRPSTTITTDSRIGTPGHHDEQKRQYGEGSITLTVAEAATIQTFPADHPWQGTKTAQHAQIGNAIPPLLARAVLAQVTK